LLANRLPKLYLPGYLAHPASLKPGPCAIRQFSTPLIRGIDPFEPLVFQRSDPGNSLPRNTFVNRAHIYHMRHLIYRVRIIQSQRLTGSSGTSHTTCSTSDAPWRYRQQVCPQTRQPLVRSDSPLRQMTIAITADTPIITPASSGERARRIPRNASQTRSPPSPPHPVSLTRPRLPDIYRLLLKRAPLVPRPQQPSFHGFPLRYFVFLVAICPFRNTLNYSL